MTMIAFAVPILDGKLEDWKHMILDTMHGDNKQSTDQSRENAGVHERSYLQKMESGHACILTWEGEHPLPFWLDLMDVALPEFTEILAGLHGEGVFNEENPQKMLAEMVYDSFDKDHPVAETDTQTSMIALALPILPGKLDAWKKTILNKMLIKNKKETDAIRNAAKVRERSFLQELPDGHIVVLTFEGVEPVAGYEQVMRNLPPEFAAAAMECHGLDENALPPPLPELVYDSRQ